MPESEKNLPDPLSKTKRKDAMLELQKLGEALIRLSDTELAKISLPDDLLDAIRVAHTLKTHESIRRHLQFIGKKMRHIDAEEIRTALAAIKFSNDQRTSEFHEIEICRTNLLAGGDSALQQLLEAHPHVDRQHVRQLVRQSIQDQKKNKNSGAYTELFRYLKSILAVK